MGYQHIRWFGEHSGDKNNVWTSNTHGSLEYTGEQTQSNYFVSQIIYWESRVMNAKYGLTTHI